MKTKPAPVSTGTERERRLRAVMPMKYTEYPADVQNLDEARDIIETELTDAGFSPKAIMQISIAFEELFVNICHYAYPQEGDTPPERYAKVGFCMQGDDAVIELWDGGVPFNPLAREDPDITLPAEQRGIGGLGIFMTKKFCDRLEYRRDGDFNVVTMYKARG